MTRDDVVDRLARLEPCLREQGVASLYIFGSYARNEAGPGSDIDILAEFSPGREPDLSRFMNAYHALEAAFPGTSIEFATRDSVVPVYRAGIEHSTLRVF